MPDVEAERGLLRELEGHAAGMLQRFQRPRRHHMACALRLAGGQMIAGLNIVVNRGVASVCAEQVALGEAMKHSSDVAAVITLRATFGDGVAYELVPPCGRCREVLCEYAPHAHVVLRDGGSGYALVPVETLLPCPFERRSRDIART